jgi:hypothetical protein
LDVPLNGQAVKVREGLEIVTRKQQKVTTTGKDGDCTTAIKTTPPHPAAGMRVQTIGV